MRIPPASHRRGPGGVVRENNPAANCEISKISCTDTESIPHRWDAGLTKGVHP